VVTLIPIVQFAALGYVIQVVRNVRDGQQLPLPEWDQFGQYFMDGLWLFLIGLVWSLPILLVVCLQVAGGAILAENQDAAEAFGVASACFTCLYILWGLVLLIVSPAIAIRYAEVGQFMSGFQFSEIFSVITADVGQYIVVLLLMVLAMYIIAPLGIILCIVGVYLTQFWSYLVTGNLIGQLAARQQAS
jgi:hypothetical protein